MKYTTKSLNETLRLGKTMASNFNSNIIGLIGELGSGKTAFVKGVGEYFNIQNITSPSFVIMKVYKTQVTRLPSPNSEANGGQASYPPAIACRRSQWRAGKLPACHRLIAKPMAGRQVTRLVHVDCYRLENYKSLIDIGLEEYLNDPHCLVLIEWADKIKEDLPKNTKYIKFKLGKTENERIIQMN